MKNFIVAALMILMSVSLSFAECEENISQGGNVQVVKEIR